MLGQEIQGDPKQCIWNFEKALSNHVVPTLFWQSKNGPDDVTFVNILSTVCLQFSKKVLHHQNSDTFSMGQKWISSLNLSFWFCSPCMYVSTEPDSRRSKALLARPPSFFTVSMWWAEAQLPIIASASASEVSEVANCGAAFGGLRRGSSAVAAASSSVGARLVAWIDARGG